MDIRTTDNDSVLEPHVHLKGGNISDTVVHVREIPLNDGQCIGKVTQRSYKIGH